MATLAAENPGLVQAMVTGFLGFKAVSAVAAPLGATVSVLKNLGGAASFAAKAFQGGGLAKGLVNVMAGATSANPIIAKMGMSVAGFTKMLAKLPGVVTPVVKVLGTVIRFVNPWVAGFTVAAGALTWFFTKTETGQKVWAGFIDVLQSAWQWLSSSFTAVWDTLKGKVTGFVDGVSQAWGTFKAELS